MTSQLANRNPNQADLANQVASLRDIGRRFYERGWSVGTSSNYSVVTRRDPLELLVTASGMDKGQLTDRDFVRIDSEGLPSLDSQPKSSAETMLHVALAHELEINSVLHTHSIWGTLLSDVYFEQGEIQIEGYEMLKGLRGITTHADRVSIRIFENTQDIPVLADEVARLRKENDPAISQAFLIHRHGLYTWGRTVDEARRHVEILEFLFEVVGRRLSLAPSGVATAIESKT